MFEELDVSGGVPGARVRDVKEALIYYDREIEQQNAGIQATPDLDAKEAKCPFGFIGGPNPHASPAEKAEGGGSSLMKTPVSYFSSSSKQKFSSDKKKLSSGARCPWPFVFFHDPIMGMRDWQTWFVIGLALCWCWSRMNDIH